MSTVLVVDDDANIRRLLRRLLRHLPGTIIEAECGDAAIAHLEQSAPAIVLTDLRMPDGDGFDVLRAAKRLRPETPVVIMTGSGEMSDSMKALREGAANFLTKPFHTEDLVAIVQRSLEAGHERLQGFITERHFELAEEEFPGITSFYASCSPKPSTFLDLMRKFTKG